MQIRHPLAMAQFANHPSQGSQPNVMPAPYDFSASSSEGRPFGRVSIGSIQAGVQSYI